MKTNSNCCKKPWQVLLILMVLSQFSCLHKKNIQQSDLPVIEHFDIEEVITSEPPLWIAPSNESMNSAHYNLRYIGKDFYSAFINSTLDSVVICNYGNQSVVRFPIPYLNGSMVELLYFHNPDSIFIFFDRQYLYLKSRDGVMISDFILCNKKGEVINKYSLDNVPYIYKGQKNPLVQIRTQFINNNLIQNGRLYIPFSIYLPDLKDSIHLKLKMSLVCEYDLMKKAIRMLDISLPVSLIGKKFKSDLANGKMLHLYLVDDTTLEYHFYNYGSVYLYDLNKNTTREVFSAANFPIQNTLEGEGEAVKFFNFYGFEFSSKENLYLRNIMAVEYDPFQVFGIRQIFDTNFKLLGCQIYSGIKPYLLTDTNFGTLFFDKDQLLSIRPRNTKGVYYHVKPGKPTYRTIEYIEKNYLIKQQEEPVTEAASGISFDNRVLQYFAEMQISEGSKVVMVGFDKTCVHCLEYLFGSWQRNEEAFRAQNIHYLFIGSDTAFVEQLIAGYKIPQEFVWIDEAQVYKKYFSPEERHLNTLVYYKSGSEAEVIICDFKTLDGDFRRFLRSK